MALKLVPDLGGPAVVTVVDLGTKAMAPKWNEWITYGMAVVGYVGGWMGWGGDFVKNIGIASFPLAAEKLYDRFKTGAGASQRLSYRPAGVSRFPAPAYDTQFEGVRLSRLV